MRLFVGFPAPEELQERLTAELKRAPNIPHGLREFSRETWHVTVSFLNEVHEMHAQEIINRVDMWTQKAPKPQCTFVRFETFPKRRPRLLTAYFELSEAEQFMVSVSRLRDVLSIYAPEIDRKPWHPHLSLARASRGHRLLLWQHAIAPMSWTPSRLTLFSSIPGPNGSIYTAIETFQWTLSSRV